MALMNDPVLFAASVGTGLPFLAMAVILIFTRRNIPLSCGISVGSITVSLLSAYYLLIKLWDAGAPIEYKAVWMQSSSIIIPFGYLLDPTSLLMLAIVASIAFLVQVYSLGYMAGDPGISRYYAFQSLFAWAMMTMVIAPGLMQLYIFWELVGLASYLLIGFYYEKWSASQAGKKAFVMTRLGDIGFFLGIIALLLGFGNLGILDLNAAAQAGKIVPGLVTLSGLLIFCGVIGKSAQFPLITWLPDAMEGPTPVSALLHSATMVAAGVYMFSRIFPFFAASETTMTVALAIGTITMLLASTMAMATYDLKQVWAYSTVSQLGFMVMALAAGGFFPGVFHLTTHAGFKALLFLTSGVFIHHFHTNDMRVIGQGGGRSLKVPMITMTVAAAALAGVFPLSGFFSKEAILGALANQPSKIWVIAGLIGAFLTAYYSFRLIFFVAFPRKPAGHEAHAAHDAHAHGDHEEHREPGYIYKCMAWPLVILASVTVVLGFGQHALETFLLGPKAAEAMRHAAEAHHHTWLLWTAVCAALSGILLAWLEFGRRSARQLGFLKKFPSVETLFAERWYMDAFYRKFLDSAIYAGVTSLFTKNDRRVIDGAIDAFCRSFISGGRIASYLQGGMLQHNLVLMTIAAGVVILYFVIG